MAWALLALLLAVGLARISYELTRSELIGDREERVAEQAYVNSRLVRNAMRVDDADLSALLSSLEGNAESVVLAEIDGEWFASSVGTSPDLLPASLRDTVGDGTVARQIVAIDGVPRLVMGVPIAEPDADYFELASLADIERALDRLAVGLAVGAVVAVLAAAAVGWYASGRVLRPLGRMADAASGIAKGDLGTRLDVVEDRDLRRLERAFNEMADAVQTRIDREHRFTSDVSHELRSPLAAMASTVDLARRQRRSGAPHDTEETEVLDELRLRVDAFAELVDDLLEISRVDSGAAVLDAEVVDPRALVQAVIATTGIDDLNVDTTDDAPHAVLADKRRLGRIVMNLVENARYYAGGATRIEIDGTADRWTITVDDNGPGVPEHERRHVFGRFARGEQARSSTDGTGLGLALATENARLHGGTIELDDAPGGGARFVIDLPIGDVADSDGDGEGPWS